MVSRSVAFWFNFNELIIIRTEAEQLFYTNFGIELIYIYFIKIINTELEPKIIGIWLWWVDKTYEKFYRDFKES